MSLDALESVGDNLRIYVNPELLSISMPALNNTSNLEIWSNYKLSCDYQQIVSQVTPGAIIDVCGNGPGDACGPSSCP